MSLEGTIGVFVTKLFIKEYDYDKIDYEEGTIELSGDRMLVNLSMKPSKEYKLVNLVEVKYIG